MPVSGSVRRFVLTFRLGFLDLKENLSGLVKDRFCIPAQNEVGECFHIKSRMPPSTSRAHCSIPRLDVISTRLNNYTFIRTQY